MLALAAAWLVVLILELTGNESRVLMLAGNLIWALFILEFIIEFILAPDKRRYLSGNMLVAFSLALPALRILRVFRFLPVYRNIQLLRVFARVNRGMILLEKSFRKRGLGYVIALTVIIIAAGAGAMYYYERGNPGMTDYWSAVWWTAMMITTMGSGEWPRSPEGKLLAFLLAVYAFSIFGYFTAAVAAFFIDIDKNK